MVLIKMASKHANFSISKQIVNSHSITRKFNQLWENHDDKIMSDEKLNYLFV